MKLLVIGFSVRHIACSAARAGHCVIAADAFCDLDLLRCTSEAFLLSQDEAVQSIQALAEKVSPDAVVLGPGLEEARVRGFEVLNNPPERAALVSDKLWLARWLERRGFPFIKTQASAEGIDFPAVIKPQKGAGGVGCRLVRSRTDLSLEEGMIIQELIEGRPASVSVIGSGREARTIATNEQIIGAAFAGAEDFRYSGNITPLEPDCPELAEMAEEIISELRLVGSNGVDFLLTENGPVVVEVNPRFQGSLDTVELSTGINVFNAHLDAFRGVLPELPLPASRRAAGRIIFYAQDALKIGPELLLESLVDGLTDIPRPGSLIRKGDPVASILATGANRTAVIELLMKRAAELNRALEAK